MTEKEKDMSTLCKIIKKLLYSSDQLVGKDRSGHRCATTKYEDLCQ